MAKNNKNNNRKNTGSAYTVEEIARMGGNAPHSCRGFECQEQNGPKPGAMGPEQAGHLGGTAPHSCRGLQCLKEEEEGKRTKGQSAKNRNRNR